jgi:hypothetical protein
VLPSGFLGFRLPVLLWHCTNTAVVQYQCGLSAGPSLPVHGNPWRQPLAFTVAPSHCISTCSVHSYLVHCSWMPATPLRDCPTFRFDISVFYFLDTLNLADKDRAGWRLWYISARDFRIVDLPLMNKPQCVSAHTSSLTHPRFVSFHAQLQLTDVGKSAFIERFTERTFNAANVNYTGCVFSTYTLTTCLFTPMRCSFELYRGFKKSNIAHSTRHRFSNCALYSYAYWGAFLFINAMRFIQHLMLVYTGSFKVKSITLDGRRIDLNIVCLCLSLNFSSFCLLSLFLRLNPSFRFSSQKFLLWATFESLFLLL